MDIVLRIRIFYYASLRVNVHVFLNMIIFMGKMFIFKAKTISNVCIKNVRIEFIITICYYSNNKKMECLLELDI